MSAEPERRQGFALLAEARQIRSDRACVPPPAPHPHLDYYEPNAKQLDQDLGEMRRRLVGAFGFIRARTSFSPASC